MTLEAGTKPEKKSYYLDLVKNKTLMYLWTGKTVSNIGDTFFDLAVMWVVYAQSGSVLQSAIVGMMSHLSAIIFSPIAGAVADRFDRKTIMWSTNVLSAVVVGAVAYAYFTFGHIPLIVAALSIFLLIALGTFINPAEASVMPEIVGKSHLSTAYGIFSTITQSATLLGQALAGFVIAGFGAGWALSGDAISFFFVAGCIALAKIPKRTVAHPASVKSTSGKKGSFWGDIKSGWQYTKTNPTIYALLWLAMLINVISYLGPLFPALVSDQLKSGAAAYGMIEAASVVGAMVGGVMTGYFDRRFKTGHLMGVTLLLSGFCPLGIAMSTSVILTIILVFILTFFTQLASILMMSAQLALVAEEYRGRVFGISRSFVMAAMPISTLIAGYLGDIIGVSILFTFAGFWVIGISCLALLNPHTRNIEIDKS
jgi:MFS transporter, DHA3 family, macrolide efflux protein